MADDLTTPGRATAGAAYAKDVLNYYNTLKGEHRELDAGDITDLLTDLLHYLHHEEGDAVGTLHDHFDSAVIHYGAEQEEED